MTNEILKQNWKQFFDATSCDYSDWETRVEVLKDDIGAQVLSEGLPLVGFVFEEKDSDKVEEGQSNIEIILGEQSGAHQTHTIFNPRAVTFLPMDDQAQSGGTIEIEDAENAKTLVHLVQPASVLTGYTEFEESVSVVSTGGFNG